MKRAGDAAGEDDSFLTKVKSRFVFPNERTAPGRLLDLVPSAEHCAGGSLLRAGGGERSRAPRLPSKWVKSEGNLKKIAQLPDSVESCKG